MFMCLVPFESVKQFYVLFLFIFIFILASVCERMRRKKPILNSLRMNKMFHNEKISNWFDEHEPLSERDRKSVV